MSGNVTLREVAQEAGVHVSTASRALNPETRSIVNAETARRVINAAERLGYRPHPLARALRTQRTLTIGMTVPDLANPIFAIIYAGAEARLAEEGYSLLISSDSLLISDDDDVERIEEVNGILRGHYVDGWILADAHLDATLPEMMTDEGLPAVLVNRTADRISAPAVVSDHEHAMGLVVKHLVELGHTAIAHIAGPENVSSGAERRRAFVHSMQAEGLKADGSLIAQADAFLIGAGRAACERLLDSRKSFTAIIAANDLIALGCYDALEARGVSVPDDVSVTGFDDMAFIDRVDPPLTTVSVSFYEMGVAAGALMLSRLASSHEESAMGETGPVLIPSSLVVRSSTASPPKAADAEKTR